MASSLRGKRAGFIAAELALGLLQVTRLPTALSAALWFVAGALLLYWAYFEADRVWFGESVRESPGFGADLIAWIDTGDLERRQYILDCRNSAGAAAALYLSAVGKPTFAITDTMGETYPVETSTGFGGIPFGHWIYLAVEAAKRPTKTYLRIKLNGRVIAERVLPFGVALGGDDWTPTIGANTNGKANAKFRLGEFVLRSRTLGVLNSRRMLHYFQRKYPIHD